MTADAKPPRSGGALLRGGLVHLAVRRAAPRGVLLLLAIVGVLAALQDWGFAPGTVADADEAGRLTRGFTRQGVWTMLLLLAGPLLVHRAAATFHEWREGDSEWLAPRPGGGGAFLRSSFAGLVLAGVLVLGGIALVAEMAVGEGGPTLRLVAELDHPSAMLLDPHDAVHWEHEDCPLASLPLGAVVRVRPTVAPGAGPAADVRVTARGSDAAASPASHTTTARLKGRHAILVPVPRGERGHLVLELAREGPGAVVVLPEHCVELLAPVANDHLVGWDLFLRLLAAAVAWIALGLGLGAWVRPAVASFLVLALWALPWWWGLGTAWLPGGDLPAVWSLLGEGLAPPARGAVEPLATLGIVLLGLGIGAPGLSRGRWIG